MQLFTALIAELFALAFAQSNSPNDSISLLEVYPRSITDRTPNEKTIAGYPDLSSFANLITESLGKSFFGYIDALNTTSTDKPLTIFAPTNSAFNHFISDTAMDAFPGQEEQDQ